MQPHAIIGLGNPGSQYHNTRHNCGFRFIDLLAEQLGVELKLVPRLKCRLVRTNIAGIPATLVQPITYMNRSGEAVQHVVQYYKIESSNIVVIHDELDLPAGVVRLKVGGGAGGHNGLTDIIARVSTREFVRIRIGIGKPATKFDTVPYVLSVPPRTERELIEDAIDQASQSMRDVLDGNIERAMNRLHARPASEDSTQNK